MSYPVLKGISNVLVHTPDLVRYGSKPAREIPKDPGLIDRLTAHLRSYEEAVAYPPHQVYVGNLRPEKLWDIERPWFRNLQSPAARFGLCGEIMPQAEFYGFMKIVDEFELVEFERRFISRVRGKLAEHPLITSDDLARLGAGIEMGALEAEIASGPFRSMKTVSSPVASARDTMKMRTSSPPFSWKISPRRLREYLPCAM